MCAIHGFCWTEDGALKRMLDAAAHRGPDGLGVFKDERISLGHNLLAVTDTPARSEQPWAHAGRYELVFNGEVYNHIPLRVALDHLFRSDTDTETLAVGLAQQGLDFLRKIDGMFALAWYDREAGTVTLARDSNGARPLYYAVKDGRLAFSSEIRSLLALGLDRVVCKEAFRHYYHSGLVAGSLTMFRGIYKLVPGEVVTFELPGGCVAQWNLNDARPKPFAGFEADIPALLADHLSDAVGLATMGRRNLGLFLSGGMDSSAVLYEATRPLKTFTTRFRTTGVDHAYNSDANVARDTAKLYKAEHREVLVTEQLWVDNFENAVVALEEPRQGKSHPAYYLTNKAARAAGVIVTLSGDGGDELLAGYKHYNTPPFRTRFETLRAGHRGLKNPDLQLTVDQQVEYLEGWLPRGGLTGDALNDFMYTDCLHTLAEDFLARSDKIGAAFGMEARFPLMCSEFRDFVRGIPGHLKTAEGTPGGWDANNKPLMRAAYAANLPTFVTRKLKTGWRAPTDEWVIGRPSMPARDGSPVRELFRSLLRDPEVRELFELTDDVVENRFLNNRDLVGPNKPSGKPGVGIGLRSQKELFTAAIFAQWKKSFNMRMW
mgnify:CR=1 FL=1